MSEKSIKSWKNPDNYVNKEEYRQMLSDRASKNFLEVYGNLIMLYI
jgi:hypothetical protein